jgi:hypothetical protein
MELIVYIFDLLIYILFFINIIYFIYAYIIKEINYDKDLHDSNSKISIGFYSLIVYILIIIRFVWIIMSIYNISIKYSILIVLVILNYMNTYCIKL